MTLQNNQSDNTLIFIPDISGFTKFVNNTDIHHAKHIIEELLEVLIDANEMGLELSEIEGDALLFFRKGKAPTAAELLAQIQRMYTKFHSHLKKYETHRICSCGACCSAIDLQLKFIAHYGEVADKQVKDRTKLFGKDVIVAHRLLKNEVDSDEYGLFSNNLVRACSTWLKLPEVAWDEVYNGESSYDFGSAKYCYLQLSALEEHIPEPKIEEYGIPEATDNILEYEHVINASIDVVFDVLSDLDFRHHFMPGLKGSDKINHKVNQVGATHRCVIKENESDPFFVVHDFKLQKNKITFIESNHRDQMSNVFTLVAVGKGVTRITSTLLIKPNIFKKLLFNWFKKKQTIGWYKMSFDNLNKYCQKLLSEKRPHPNRIILPKKVLSVA